jgi:hypothetical protein
MMFSFALIMSLGGLLGMHVYVIAANTSTVEQSQLFQFNPFSHQRKRVLTAAQAKKVPLQMKLFGVGRNSVVTQDRSRVRYSNDYYRNWTDYMGKDWTKWFVPVLASDAAADGYEWKLYPRKNAHA